MRKSGTPFPGLKLSRIDQAQIADIKRSGALRERDWRRVRILELLDAGWNLTHTGRGVGPTPVKCAVSDGATLRGALRQP